MKKLILCLIALSFVVGMVPAGEESSQLFVVSGEGTSRPRSYVPPLIANGSLNMLVDYQGCQSQQKYSGMIPGIWWAGRRYEISGHPIFPLAPFGYFEQEISCNGQIYKEPSRWTQTLNTKEAVTICQGDYGDSLSVETTVFVPLSHDIVAIKKKFIPKKQDIRSAMIT